MLEYNLDAFIPLINMYFAQFGSVLLDFLQKYILISIISIVLFDASTNSNYL